MFGLSTDNEDTR